ncbi:hypothetical protein KFL_002460160 [Klebsormidium nitens]|uniref:AAA+ ATPase domain-containing protein n=1 Tax=Klebsormidium nitens TaxID=105231 RepID=A0A1Y1I932_KLENI|nr:hypothetical protein KFL_002460160 [Klebsormidium nitens]|eukprot:GAQ85641.1 hypothetical protein KFL_002460160 [Klebsormidium nitens]
MGSQAVGVLPSQPPLRMTAAHRCRSQTGSSESESLEFGLRMQLSPAQHCEWGGTLRCGQARFFGRNSSQNEWQRNSKSESPVGTISQIDSRQRGGFLRRSMKSSFSALRIRSSEYSFPVHGLEHRKKPILAPRKALKSSHLPSLSFSHSTTSTLQASLSSEVISGDRKTLNPNPEEELSQLLDLLPGTIRTRVEEHPERDALVEIVLDLGRRPMARFPSGDVFLSEDSVTAKDIELAVGKVGLFGGDNRAGIDRTLHRVSAIRSRSGRIVGLTCRVGRAIPGSAEMVRDLVSTGASILLMGPPGVGKTTAIREVSRMLADEYNKRVVIVDTSNEIGGDGDIPHPGIGRARRMQVPSPELQHHVMIEAVENHMPQVIVIDEIGTELEAAAAGTIAQRGVQLVGTAHGMTIENLIKNPSLCQLAGGIESVTLGDDEARRRGVQKSVLERKGPPTFSAAVEMISRTEWRVHRSLSATVDAMLLGKRPRCEYRKIDTGGGFDVDDGTESESEESERETGAGNRRRMAESNGRRYRSNAEDDSDSEEEFVEALDRMNAAEQRARARSGEGAGRLPAAEEKGPLQMYPFEVTESALEQVFETLDLDRKVRLTDNIGDADVILALRAKLKHNSWVRDVAKLRQLPIYAIKANTMPQMVRAVRAILGLDAAATSAAFGVGREDSRTGPGLEPPVESSEPSKSNNVEQEIDALEEARAAVEKIVIPQGLAVELLPRPWNILLLQLNLIEGYKLVVDKVGSGKSTRLRILPEYLPQTTGGRTSDGHVATSEASDASNALTDDVKGDVLSQERVTVVESASSVTKVAAVLEIAGSETLLGDASESISLQGRIDSLPGVGMSGAESADVSSQLSENRTGVYLVKEAAEYAKTSWQKDNAFMEGYQSSGRLARNGRKEGRDQKFKRTREIVDEEYDEAELL